MGGWKAGYIFSAIVPCLFELQYAVACSIREGVPPPHVELPQDIYYLCVCSVPIEEKLLKNVMLQYIVRESFQNGCAWHYAPVTAPANVDLLSEAALLEHCSIQFRTLPPTPNTQAHIAYNHCNSKVGGGAAQITKGRNKVTPTD